MTITDEPTPFVHTCVYNLAHKTQTRTKHLRAEQPPEQPPLPLHLHAHVETSATTHLLDMNQCARTRTDTQKIVDQTISSIFDECWRATCSYLALHQANKPKIEQKQIVLRKQATL